MPFLKKLLLINTGVIAITPLTVLGCACGCGLLSPGTESMMPKSDGGIAYVQDDYQSQTHNRSGDTFAPADDNGDKAIKTNTLTAGVRYMFDWDWGVQLDVPLVSRTFTTTGGASGSDIVTNRWTSLGDIRLKGVYTGFSDDMSTGLTFGVKLPTGDFRHEDAYDDIDRDSEIGSGSVDALIGAFHRGAFSDQSDWAWFAQAQSDLPALIQDGYRPGFQFDVAIGASYHGIHVGSVGVSPVAQVVATVKTRDTGPASADPVASGYERVMLAPGLEIDADPVIVYAEVDLPVYDHVTGDQLTSKAIFKLMIGCKF